MESDKRKLPPGPDGFPGSARLLLRFLALVEADPGCTVADIRLSGKAITGVEPMLRWMYDKKCFDVKTEVRIGSTRDRLTLNVKGKKYLAQVRAIQLEFEKERLERQGITIKERKAA